MDGVDRQASSATTARASRFTGALALALTAAWVATACAAPPTGLTAEQVEEMLQAHDGWRRMVGVSALSWSEDLARGAQAHADNLAAHGCRLSHRGMPPDVGENLFASVFASRVDAEEIRPMRPAEVVKLWAAERANYDYASNRCASGKDCTHYTQLVARRTKAVGCGMAVCPERGQVWVCDYYPAGNIEGKRPY